MAVPPPTARTAIERQVLDIVGGLIAELGQPAASPPALDDSLDRDLGISSLERVELLLRIERVFGVRLPDAVMAEAASPKDLVAAILRASPEHPSAGHPSAGHPSAWTRRAPPRGSRWGRSPVHVRRV